MEMTAFALKGEFGIGPTKFALSLTHERVYKGANRVYMLSSLDKQSKRMRAALTALTLKKYDGMVVIYVRPQRMVFMGCGDILGEFDNIRSPERRKKSRIAMADITGNSRLVFSILRVGLLNKGIGGVDQRLFDVLDERQKMKILALALISDKPDMPHMLLRRDDKRCLT